MRRVYTQPKSADCNSAQRVLRGFLEKTPASYIKLMTDLERSTAGGGMPSGVVGVPGAPPAAFDDGEVRVRELIAELLAEAKAPQL